MKKIIPHSGFTLLELMLTLLMAAVLVALAAPMMDSTIKTQSIRSLQRDFHSALVYARSEAVTRNRVISVCSSSNGASCNAGVWSDGWIIFIDSSTAGFGNGVLDNGETLLRANVYEGSAVPSVVDPDADAAVSFVTFSLRGFTYNSNRVYVQICPSDSEDSFARGLMLERSGRVVYSRDDNGDGVHDRIFQNDAGVAVSTNLDC
ncbi:GspH/FimT family protein [Saccharophagus degradans]|uniref:Type II secretion system protein H n=1 Tax=Saccharophagus degradans (strain 2-40 / ATCC 43961 / DSM 17024) TaxID=203122 RepID=Q21HK7_SACD2|nr:GspH/FimT family protein [Saccharophagus degradans]ABD81822.1 conserved hypothetical protein [Saccharophagus degradans 2-40]